MFDSSVTLRVRQAILDLRFCESMRDLVSWIRLVRRPVRIMASAPAWAKAMAVALPMPLPWLCQLFMWFGLGSGCWKSHLPAPVMKTTLPLADNSGLVGSIAG